MTRSLLLAALIAAPMLTAPALAEPAPPPPPAGMAPPPMGMGGEMGAGMGGTMGARMFPSMSEAGRKAIHEAMMAGGSRQDQRQKVEAAREKMMVALEADRFDPAAVKRAMDEERAIADGTRQQRQAAMLAAFGKLSPEDRKAFVADSRAMKARMQARMEGWRQRMRERMMLRREGTQPMPPQPAHE